MGSCIQGPASCNEQDGVQSLFHCCFQYSAPASDLFWIHILGRAFIFLSFLFQTTPLRVRSATVCRPNRTGAFVVPNPAPCSDSGQHGGERVLTRPERQGSCIEIVISGQIFGHLRSRPESIKTFYRVYSGFHIIFLRINCSQSLFFCPTLQYIL